MSIHSHKVSSKRGSGSRRSRPLVATAAGLFVAIPAVIAYNHFVSRVKSYATEMDAAASELVATVHRAALR